MKKLIIASTGPSAGKTSFVIGLARVLGKNMGYMKPFGDRLLYRKKRLWDYDAALITNIFGLGELPEDITIGFDHSKLRFMYNHDSMREKFLEILAAVSENKEIVFIEGGRDMRSAISVYLDPVSVSRYDGGKLILIAAGDEELMVDDIVFINRHMDLKGITFGGIIFNKIHNPDDFSEAHLPAISKTGFDVLGVLPFRPELACYSVAYLAERLFAKVITGKANLHRKIQKIFIGAMHADAALEAPFFKAEDKVVITSGDRSDMITAAMETGSAAVVITNNILPTANLITRAEKQKIPLLLVPGDTYEIAKQVDGIEPLTTMHEEDKLQMLEDLVRKHVNWEKITR